MQRKLGGKHWLALVTSVFLVVGVLVAGCGSSTPGQTAQATPTSSATATTQPTATATLLPVAFQTPPNCTPVASSAFSTGTYSNGSKLWIYQPNGQISAESGTSCYAVVQQHILYFSVAWCSDSPAMYGDYTWTFDGTYLHLTLVQDHCSQRMQDLVGQFASSSYSWLRQTGG